MFMSGSSMRAIGREVGVSVTTVFHDLDRARQKWKEETAKSYADHLPIKLAELDAIRAAAWDGWKRSLLDEVTKKREAGETDKGANSKRSTQRRGQSGNPIFLARLESCLRLECRLLGLLDGDIHIENINMEVVEVVIQSKEQHEEFKKTLSFAAFQKQMGKTG